MKLLFVLVLASAVGMGAVFGKVTTRKSYPVGPRYSTATPTPAALATQTPESLTDPGAPPAQTCMIDWSVPVTEENLARNSECYRTLYYDPVTRSYPGAPPFCPPNNSAWEAYFDPTYLYEWCYDNPPPPTPTEISPYPYPPGYP